MNLRPSGTGNMELLPKPRRRTLRMIRLRRSSGDRGRNIIPTGAKEASPAAEGLCISDAACQPAFSRSQQPKRAALPCPEAGSVRGLQLIGYIMSLFIVILGPLIILGVVGGVLLVKRSMQRRRRRRRRTIQRTQRSTTRKPAEDQSARRRCARKLIA
jgi:hypothetical protein